MSRLWATPAANAGVPEDDFKRAALSLTCGQILYFSKLQQRGSYNLVRENRQAFEEVLDHLGLRLGIDDAFRFVYVVPAIEVDRILTKDETLLALVLRHIYHELSSRGEADGGTVTIGRTDLYSSYLRITGKELPKRGDGKERQALFLSMGRFGIMKEEADPDSDDAVIHILPGIAALISSETISRMAFVHSDESVQDGSAETEPEE